MEKDFDIEIKKYLTNGGKLNRNYNLENVPDTDGIYIVECPDGIEPEFMDETTAIKTQKIKKGIHKGELKSTEEHTAEDLTIKYKNGNRKILYIGCAPLNEDEERGLNKRLKELINHGFNMGKNHYGGKELWQIKNIEDMKLYWHPIKNAEEIEKELLLLHLKKYAFYRGKKLIKKLSYPVANWRL